MPSPRLALALRELQAGDWLIFEQFASEFLAVEFPSLRTRSAAGGDKGRDAELFTLDDVPKTAFQYSVANDWKTKINKTRRRLAETMPKVTRLVYATNQTIGPDADALVETFRATGIALDVRDKSWFVERELTHPQRTVASSELAENIVTPLLTRAGITSRVGTELTGDAARIALLHLSLEGYDAASERNLTKSCFEALVLAALHGSRSEEPHSLDQVLQSVSAFVPAGHSEQTTAQVKGALRRLTVRGGPVKHLTRTDEYHLSFNRRAEEEERTAEFLEAQKSLEDELALALTNLEHPPSDEQIPDLATTLRVGIEEVLFNLGERFASAIDSGVTRNLRARDVLALLTSRGIETAPLNDAMAAQVIFATLENPSSQTKRHLARLADAYTLFAFLRQTPDVQKVIVDIFQGGEIWLDTSVILPLVAETLEEPADRHMTILLKSARDAGFRLYATDGIVEEVQTHLNRSLACARTSPELWANSVPFVYRSYTAAGLARAEFLSWLEEFRGDRTPTEDLREYFESELGIEPFDLTPVAETADETIRWALQEIWMEAHDRRRMRSDSTHLTPEITTRLVAHDVENTAGVIQLRAQTGKTRVGYTHWFLTLDGTAFRLATELTERLSSRPPDSPALSPDFLSQLLRLGPLRQAIEDGSHVQLPIVSSLGRYESVPKDLIALADELRKKHEGKSERVVQRHVRDEMNDLRWKRTGEITERLSRDEP